MSFSMQQFHHLAQQYPALRAATERRQDNAEITSGYTVPQAQEQASRCLQCGVPFCAGHCPLQNNIPDWLRLTAAGDLKSAYMTAAETNTFPEICGRICPQDRLCEGSCVTQQAGFGAITIGSVEKFLTDTAWQEGWITPFAPAKERSESVGIIGSGPAGLAAAEYLRKQGFTVHVYDRADRMGGLMMYGIPPFKLEKSVVQRRIDQYTASGIHFHPNTAIGAEGMPFADLREKHQAVLIATGVYRARALEYSVRGQELQGVIPAMEYLTAAGKHSLGDHILMPNMNGATVVVIGGGDTAMDCVRTAVRQGASSVTCVYRRDRANMPGSAREVKYAEEEGVHFHWLAAPLEILGNAAGAVTGINVQHMRLGTPDAAGRRSPVPVTGEFSTLPATCIINALGYEAEDLPTAFDVPELTISSSGLLKVDADYQTSLKGVFAAGDIVRGASLVVWGIVDGRAAAKAMEGYLTASL